MSSAVARAKVVKWGNSQGVRIPRNVIDAAGLRVGDDVSLRVDGHTIVIAVMSPQLRYRRAGHRSIEEIFAGYDGEPQGEEWLVGRVGAEVFDD